MKAATVVSNNHTPRRSKPENRDFYLEASYSFTFRPFSFRGRSQRYP